MLVWGKRKSGKWQTIDNVLAPVFSVDGKSVWSVGTRDEGWGILALDRKGSEEKHMGATSSRSGRASVAFAARSEGQWRVAVGQSSSEPCDEIARIVWAADGSCVWYGARRGRELWWSRMAVEE